MHFKHFRLEKIIETWLWITFLFPIILTTNNVILEIKLDPLPVFDTLYRTLWTEDWISNFIKMMGIFLFSFQNKSLSLRTLGLDIILPKISLFFGGTTTATFTTSSTASTNICTFTIAIRLCNKICN